MAVMATGANADALTLFRVSCYQGEDAPVVLWAESKVQAEAYRLDIERRLAPRRVFVETHRFTLSPTVRDVVKFLSKHCGSARGLTPARG
jgi:hypothetical protein